MIVIKLKGGLGNQLFEYACGRALSLTLDVPLGLDVSSFSDDPAGRKYELANYCIEAELLSSRESFRRIYRPWRKLRVGLNRFLRMRLSLCRDHYFIEQRPGVYDPRVVALPDGTCLSGYWQCERYFLKYRSKLLSELRLKEPLGSDAQRFAEQIQREEYAVSLHFRRGDYVADEKTAKIHNVCSMDYYRRAIEQLAGYVPNFRLFVFSDDSEWVRQNVNLNMPMTVVSEGTEGYEDIYLMSLCHHNIIANSSFSWWGAWLNEHPGKTVIAPTEWFSGSSCGALDIVPDQWVRVEK